MCNIKYHSLHFVVESYRIIWQLHKYCPQRKSDFLPLVGLQTVMRLELDQLPVNGALLSLVGAGATAEDGGAGGEPSVPPPPVPAAHTHSYFLAVKCIKDLALFLKPFSGGVYLMTSFFSILFVQ